MMTLGDTINAHPIIFGMLGFACFVVFLKTAFLAYKDRRLPPSRCRRCGLALEVPGGNDCSRLGGPERPHDWRPLKKHEDSSIDRWRLCGKPTVFRREDGKRHGGPALPCPLPYGHSGDCE